MQKLFDELKTYVRFGPVDEAHLTALAPLMRGAFAPIVDEFYTRMGEHPDAAAVMTGGEEQLGRLKRALLSWLEEFFAGPWDVGYAQQRARIGRRHVEVKLPQHYMLTAMAVIRAHLCDVVLSLEAAPEEANARVAAVNKLCDLELAIMLHTYRQDSERRVQASERLATFGELTSAICHELRNPLGVIETSSFILRRRLTDGYAMSHLERMQRQVRRASAIISNMLDIVRVSPLNSRPFEVGALAAQAADLLMEDRGHQVELEIPDPRLVALADSSQVLQVLANLLGNAADAAGPTGVVRLSVRAHQGAHDACVRFLVSDSGPGVHPSVIDRVFEPLVTKKETGIGLGLTLSRKLAEQQPGVLDLVPGELSGAGFALDLPQALGPDR